MMKPLKCSLIIPFYNEGERIIPILNEVQKVDSIKEIIVIDDGSNSDSKKVLAKIKGIKLITNQINKGKTSALKTGVDNAKLAVVVFVDSDLTNFKSSHFNKMISLFKDNDMVLGYPGNDVFYSEMIGFNIAYTGERIIKKKILLKHGEIFKSKNYLIEPAMNKVLFHSYKVVAICLDGVGQTYKIQKIGIRGFLTDIRMWWSYLIFLGIREFIFQLKYSKSLSKVL